MMSNTGLIDILVDVDSKEITMANSVAYTEGYTTTEAHTTTSAEAPTVNNFDNVQSRSVMFVASLDVG
jgi:hypothetical protein